MEQGAISLSTEQVNTAFINAQQYINPVIATRATHYNKLWGKLIGRGTFNYGEGYTKTSHVYHGGTADQSASRLWTAMAPSTAENSACRYEASLIKFGHESKQYSIYQTLRRTEDLCLTDLLFKWQVAQMIKAFMSTLGDVTLGEWENFSRDTYLGFCDKFVAMEGSPAFTAAYGADTIDVSGFDLSQIGVLNQGVLDRMYQYLYRECPGAAMGNKGGMPVFSIMSSAETLNQLIENDTVKRTDMRYVDPNFLIEGIGMAREYKAWTHMYDPETFRYKLNAAGTGLVRVWPLDSKAASVGQKVAVNEEYINAPFEISLGIIKDVFQILVPPANPSIGSAKFDAIANFGEFTWMNLKDRDNNPYGEIGYWAARFRAAPEPLANSDRAFAILHRRNVGMRIDLADSCTTTPQTDAVAILSYANVGDVAAETTRVTVILAECLSPELGAVASMVIGGGATTACVVTNYFGGTSYELTFATAADWATAMAANNGTLTVETT